MIGSRLRELRNRRNLTLAELAKFVGTTSMTISRYENDQRQPDYETLKNIANFFEVSVDFLLERTDIPTFKDISNTILSIPLYREYIPGKENVPDDSFDIVTGLYDFVFDPDTLIAFRVYNDYYAPYFIGGDILIIELTQNLNPNSAFYLATTGNFEHNDILRLSSDNNGLHILTGFDFEKFPKYIIKDANIIGRVLSLHRGL